MEELRIKCPSCGIILDVRNSRNEAVKRIVCPNCQKHLAIDFQDESFTTEPKSIGSLYYGEAVYALTEGVNTIGAKGLQTDATIQIATGDSTLLPLHATIRVVRLSSSDYKCIISTADQTAPVVVNSLVLHPDDQIVLVLGDQILLGHTLLIYK